MRSFNGAFTSWKFQVLFPSRGEEIHCGDIDRSRGIYESLQLFLLLPRPRNNYHAFEHPSLTDLILILSLHVSRAANGTFESFCLEIVEAGVNQEFGMGWMRLLEIFIVP